MLLCKEFTFDAAHNLVRYHGKCEALHGHTYRVAVWVEGEPDDEGMVMDFCELASIVRERVVFRLDHSYLNDVGPQPTAENIARWIWDQIEAPLAEGAGAARRRLFEVRVWETSTSCAVMTLKDREERS